MSTLSTPHLAPSWDTETMAELLVGQQQYGKAVAIYRKLVLQHPQESRFQQRLAQLQAFIAQTTPAVPAADNDFKLPLQALATALPGSIAMAIMDMDGMVVALYSLGGADIDVEALLVELTQVAKDLLRWQQQPTIGTLQEMVIRTQRLNALLMPIGQRHCLIGLTEPSSLLGFSRYRLKIALPALQQQLANH